MEAERLPETPRSAGPPASCVRLQARDEATPAGRLLQRVARGTPDVDPDRTPAGAFLADF